MVNRTPSTHLTNYRFGEEYIGRLNEDSALTSAHPDDCALFAGPPRLELIAQSMDNMAPDKDNDVFRLFGTFQAINFGSAQSVIPVKAIGSSRFFYFTANQPVTFGFSLIMMKTDNLLKVIYNNLLLMGAPVKAALKEAFEGYVFNDIEKDNMWFNLESEIFSIPFGLGVLWSNKERSFLGAAYFENALLTSYSTDIVSGRQMLMENGSFIADRVRPFNIRAIFESNIPEANVFSNFRKQVRKYFGFE
ncbi:MAG: hypothetical protein ABIM30_00665 [candidate division WOR-3 bacterium]